ncbi:MAG: 30S ribosomal protein S8 [bacterium]
MASTDPISDMLTVIRNANMRLLEKVDLPASGIKGEIVKILKQEGYVANYKRIDDRKQGLLRIYLKYGTDKSKVLTNLRRISKPGLRVYKNWDTIPKGKEGFGIFILSTSKGVMTDRKCREQKVGGELICEVW